MDFTGFFVARLKAFFAAFVTAVVPVFIHALEATFGFDIPATAEAAILTWFVALTVNYSVNLPAKNA